MKVNGSRKICGILYVRSVYRSCTTTLGVKLKNLDIGLGSGKNYCHACRKVRRLEFDCSGPSIPFVRGLAQKHVVIGHCKP